MHELNFQRLHAGSVARITDVGCRALPGARGAIEVSPVDEIVFPRAGVFERHVEGSSHLADAGHAIFFGAGEPYRIGHPLAGGDASTAFGFPRAVLAEAFEGEAGRSGWRFPVTHCPVGPEVSLVFQGLRRHLRHGGHSAASLVADELSLDLLRNVARAVRRRQGLAPVPARGGTRRRRAALVEETRHILGQSYRESTTLAAIASRVGVSPYHLTRIFREQTGTPLHRYRGLLRLREALERLAGGEEDLTALALHLGYSSHSHFTGAFRAAFGTSPSAFRSRPAPVALRALQTINENHIRDRRFRPDRSSPRSPGGSR